MAAHDKRRRTSNKGKQTGPLDPLDAVFCDLDISDDRVLEFMLATPAPNPLYGLISVISRRFVEREGWGHSWHDDLVQDVFLYLVENLGRLRKQYEPGNLRGYLAEA